MVCVNQIVSAPWAQITGLCELHKRNVNTAHVCGSVSFVTSTNWHRNAHQPTLNPLQPNREKKTVDESDKYKKICHRTWRSGPTIYFKSTGNDENAWNSSRIPKHKTLQLYSLNFGRILLTFNITIWQHHSGLERVILFGFSFHSVEAAGTEREINIQK